MSCDRLSPSDPSDPILKVPTVNWKQVLIPCVAMALLMLGISYVGIKYFESQGFWYDNEGNADVDIRV
jgi:hypothetical protein